MSFVVKKRDLTDPAQLQALIVEHVDDLERGLTILDSRLLLGQATIDVVGLDANAALVLVAVGLIADEEMFLRAVEAYSWCLEYPEAIRRLYPAAQLSSARPPRVMFIVERVPDAFHRKIKQLGFQEVDCIEFRYLDVDGTPAVYFENLARLRRNAVTIPPTPHQSAAAPTLPPVHGRSTTLKLQKLLGGDRGGRETAPTVRMVHRTPARPAATPLASATRTGRIVAPKRGEEPAVPRPSVDERVPESSVSTAVETLHPPMGRVIDPAPVPARARVPAAPPIGSPELIAANAVAEAVADVSDLFALGVEAHDAMVEAFVTIERPAENGHAVTLLNTIHELEPAVREPERAIQSPEVEIHEPEHPVHRGVEEVREPERAVRRLEPVIGEPAPTEAEEIDLDIVAAELTATAGPVAPEPLTVDVPPAVVSAPEPETVATPVRAAAPELELERPLEQASEPTSPVTAATEPTVTDSEPTVTESELPVPEPSIAASEPIVPFAAPSPAPSVFSRRPTEAVATRDQPKVSFAPQATDDRATSFAKPSGPFAKPPTLKRPLTIAPPASDGQPIAGGPKLATAATRIPAPAPATEPAATATDTESNGAPQSIGEVQFPNDGVLTRQWMEFLNQMAAGK